MAGEDTEERYPIPQWGSRPFYRFLEHLDELMTLLHLSMQGIAGLQGMPRLVELLARIDEPEKPETSAGHVDRLRRANAAAEFARREVEKEFPLLHAQAAISLWGSLEELVLSFVTLLIQHDPASREADQIQRMKVRVGDLLALDDASRARFLVEQLDRDQAGPHRQGANRFESLLEPFGLSGHLDDDLRRTLYEFYQMRNLHAHRQGSADRRFLQACPWLDVTEGQYCAVTHKQIHAYAGAAAQYVLLLVQRMGLKAGWTRDDIDKLIERGLPRIKAKGGAMVWSKRISGEAEPPGQPASNA
jgi:hypothetical protein